MRQIVFRVLAGAVVLLAAVLFPLVVWRTGLPHIRLTRVEFVLSELGVFATLGVYAVAGPGPANRLLGWVLGAPRRLERALDRAMGPALGRVVETSEDTPEIEDRKPDPPEGR